MNYMQRKNIELRIEWERRYRYKFRYPDLRGDITGPTYDQDYAMKRRVARALLKEMRLHPTTRKIWPTNVSFLLKRQAG